MQDESVKAEGVTVLIICRAHVAEMTFWKITNLFQRRIPAWKIFKYGHKLTSDPERSQIFVPLYLNHVVCTSFTFC